MKSIFLRKDPSQGKEVEEFGFAFGKPASVRILSNEVNAKVDLPDPDGPWTSIISPLEKGSTSTSNPTFFLVREASRRSASSWVMWVPPGAITPAYSHV